MPDARELDRRVAAVKPRIVRIVEIEREQHVKAGRHEITFDIVGAVIKATLLGKKHILSMIILLLALWIVRWTDGSTSTYEADYLDQREGVFYLKKGTDKYFGEIVVSIPVSGVKAIQPELPHD